MLVSDSIRSGMSKRDIIHCLKRYVPREVFSIIRKSAQLIENPA